MKTKLIAAIAFLALLLPALIWFAEEHSDRMPAERLEADRDGPLTHREPSSIQRSEGCSLPLPSNPEDAGTPSPPLAHAGLCIQVIDCNGAPVTGVDVAVARRNAAGSVTLWQGRTEGQHAIARVSKLPVWDAAYEEVYAFINEHFVNPPRRTLEPEVIPLEPIQLVLPACGALVLECIHSSGVPVPFTGMVRLQLLKPHSAGELLPCSKFSSRGKIGGREIRFSGGKIIFPRIELGLRLRFQGYLLGISTSALPTLDLDGPRLSGEIVKSVLNIDIPLLRARLVNSRGKPYSDTRVYYWAEHLESWTARCSRREGCTDLEGVLWTPADTWLADGSTRHVLFSLGRKRHGVPSDLSSIPVGDMARVALPPLVLGGVVDLGEVPLISSLRLAHGFVLDDLGAPLGGVNIRVERFPEEQPGKNWRLSILEYARSDEQGRFVLRGVPRGGRMRLKAERPGYRRAILEHREGAQEEAILRLVRGAVLVGRARLEAGIPRRGIEARLSRGGSLVRIEHLEEEGRFRFKGLAAGEYEIELTLEGLCLERLGPFGLREGEVLAPALLDPVDLRGRLRTLVVELRDSRGGAVAGVKTTVTAEQHLRWRCSATSDLQGRARFAVREDMGTLEMTVEGYRPRQIDSRISPQRVEIAGYLEILVELRDPLHVPRRPDFLELQLIEERPFGGGYVFTEIIEEDGRARFKLHGAGRYRLEWRVGRFQGLATKRETVREPKPEVLAVTEADGGRVFNLRPPPGALLEGVLQEMLDR